jgi:hypothetical protein
VMIYHFSIFSFPGEFGFSFLNSFSMSLCRSMLMTW